MISILYFGQIKSITSLAKEEWSTVSNLEELKTALVEKYPKLSTANFVFSVNQKISENVDLQDNDEVALLPPFSGG
jgi:molybdopterin synthase sulfur carrier subunit